jgi:hypothetical protein
MTAQYSHYPENFDFSTMGAEQLRINTKLVKARSVTSNTACTQRPCDDKERLMMATAHRRNRSLFPQPVFKRYFPMLLSIR